MADLKTQPTKASVEDFLNGVEPERKRKDAFEVLEMMKAISGKPPVMWGPSIVGFDTYHYKYDSGREGDFLKIGFSPRKASLTIYISSGFQGKEELLNKLGKHKTSVSCLYINKLDDIDRNILRKLIEESYKHMTQKYG